MNNKRRDIKRLVRQYRHAEDCLQRAWRLGDMVSYRRENRKRVFLASKLDHQFPAWLNGQEEHRGYILDRIERQSYAR